MSSNPHRPEADHGRTPVLLDVELVEAARTEGGRTGRSEAEQLEFWARRGQEAAPAEPHVGSYGEQLAAEGVTTVALDDDGNLVEYRPDGASEVIG